jgi:hypothetical protein
MSGCYFYLSYARESEDVFAERFFDDLSDAIRAKAGVAPDVAVGFIEPDEPRAGDVWNGAVADALLKCRTMICLYSPAYFKSDYCGKEWQIFRMRQRLYAERERAAGRQDAAWPPSLKPVPWIPLSSPEMIPEAVADTPYIVGDPNSPHNRIGVKDMIRRWVQYQDDYQDYIDNLARDVLTTSIKFKLPPLGTLPPLEEIPSAFRPQPAAAAPPPPKAEAKAEKPAGAGASTGVFISYRRSEAAAYARGLYESLVERFGRERVFLDLKNIGLGEDFVEAITAAAESCAVMIVLVSRGWSRGAQGQEGVDDYVRLEVATALGRKIRVIPILIQGAAMPAPKDLPADLSPLARRNALALSDTRWDGDVGELIETLEGLLKD